MSDDELRNVASNDDTDEEAVGVTKPRRDEFIVFNNDKDLRHYESIRVKAQYFTGIVLRCKVLTPQNMDNILKAIELDNLNLEKKNEKLNEAKKAKEAEEKEKREKELGNKKKGKKVEPKEEKKEEVVEELIPEVGSPRASAGN